MVFDPNERNRKIEDIVRDWEIILQENEKIIKEIKAKW